MLLVLNGGGHNQQMGLFTVKHKLILAHVLHNSLKLVFDILLDLLHNFATLGVGGVVSKAANGATRIAIAVIKAIVAGEVVMDSFREIIGEDDVVEGPRMDP